MCRRMRCLRARMSLRKPLEAVKSVELVPGALDGGATYSALRLDASVRSVAEPGPGPPPPLLLLRVGLMMPSDRATDAGAGG